ncbi:uncharacterized protein BP5553_06220 [Venustampulla echinocandica]|uniref:Aminoglycoside phosphotransferase domain-containing protein n=1 Tax=Venustampulla echinocandica TaxID=2656787 RepID=A0A370TMY2_9HELO|nr:uncharacterized protein BP5553_06220 [Venustampulla echinocandica]RDL36868.1 hypothetical protein BP5553_06220 [Venustampulla echinocandica]
MALRAVAEDGTIKDILEADLYRHTPYRWVYNEAHNIAVRYLKFNLSELVEAAIKVAHDNGARACVEVLKCKEGLNSKAFLLKMDNGSVIFAKLPNPCAGPAFYTTASEVATRTFLREALKFPVPRILAWSSNAENPVGAEYILEELALGEPLWNLWPDLEKLPMKPRIDIIEQVVELERSVAQLKFSSHGYIYFKKDYPQGTDLKTGDPPDSAIPLAVLEGYCFGPLVERGLWKANQTQPRPECGPYLNALEFVKERGRYEKTYVEEHGCQRMNYARVPRGLEDPRDMLELLDRYEKLALAMISPSVPEDLNASTLWHPDLHLQNIFIDPATMKITSVIDW